MSNSKRTSDAPPMFFFFDTADVDYIRRAWDRLSNILPSDAVAGITTNPIAIDRVSIKTLGAMEKRLSELCAVVSEIRGDGQGLVFAQAPLSNMRADQVRQYATYLAGLGDGKTKIGMKIPPFIEILKHAAELSRYISLNVTGVMDCAQGLRAMSYGVDYVSMIPGRMEEAGVDAKAQISFLQERAPGKGRVITGSMRTLEQLRWTCHMNTVPTIGTKVLDALMQLEDNAIADLFRRDESELTWSEHAPTTSQVQIDLSRAFFQQMDTLGAAIGAEFLGRTSTAWLSEAGISPQV